ncbi:anthranilate synthase component I [Schlesneria paludicola]|uniref:anthranilate synthase component I n=1 Tax=Schlesneria paludicola TaxID=360056 RepID=UPI00029A5669|nr:anthranilate synthase component I [Schlesneria paludicola]
MAAYTPDFATFRQLAAGARYVPVFRRLVSDTLTPVSAYCRLQDDQNSFLFESVIGGERVGRYSFVGAGPFLQIDAFDREIVITDHDSVKRYTVEDPLEHLHSMLANYQAPHLPELPRFCGGAVGYAGYDTVRYTERLLNPPEDDRHLPDMSFALYDRMVVFDQIQKTIQVVVHADVHETDLQAAYDAACRRVDALCQQLDTPTETIHLTDITLTGDPQIAFQSNFTRSGYEQAVENCKEYIRAGDIFQVVLSQRLELETTASPLDIYRALRVVNPSPFMFLVRTPVVTLIGSSPEIMVRVEDGRTTIRPLAGTRRRGKTQAEDLALERELLADEKERAEHVMLVDLARNDVGRVAEYGSVELSDIMHVERYSHVMHISSTVTGKLAPGKTALDALRAGLPAGTLSGAPKVRAMEIIDEQEPHRRGPYGGAVGYLDFTGHMDTCIALRTIVMVGQKAYVQAGAGIVADSVPASEYEETLSKARGLLKAIEIAERQLTD